MSKLILAILLISLSGCSLFQKKEEPKEISLVEAMRELGEGLTQLRESAKGSKSGLMASEASVVFNISASSTNTKNLTIDLSRPVAEGITTGTTIGGGIKSEKTSQAANTITIKFINLLTIPSTTVGGKGSLDDLGKFLKANPNTGETYNEQMYRY